MNGWYVAGRSANRNADFNPLRTVGEGPQYLKIVGKVLYRLKDIEAYEEACLIRKMF